MTAVGWILCLAAALSVLQMVTSSQDSRLHFLSTEYHGRRKLVVTVNYTAPSALKVGMFAMYEGRRRLISPRRRKFRNNQGETTFNLRSGYQLHANITFLLPDKNLTLLLHPFPAPPADNHNEAIPDVHLEPEGDVVYAAQSGDVDLLVTAGVGREGVSEESLRCRSALFTREGEEFFHDSQGCPLSVAKEVTSEVGATYRLDFNNEQNPAGFLELEAVNLYSANADRPQLIRGVLLEKRVQFSQEGGPPPVQDDTLAFVRQGTVANGRLTQICDLDLVSSCSVTCAAIGPRVSRVNVREINEISQMDSAVTSTKWGFLTVTSAPVPDFLQGGEHLFWCMAMLDEDYNNEVQQVIQVNVRQKPEIEEDVTSAVLHPNTTLEVKCKATGFPAPTLSITDPDDPDNTPLDERFPSESSSRVSEYRNVVTVQYTLSKPAFTSTLSHVRCTADNGFKDPDSVLLEIGQP